MVPARDSTIGSARHANGGAADSLDEAKVAFWAAGDAQPIAAFLYMPGTD